MNTYSMEHKPDETPQEYAERLNRQALAYNEHDAGPTIEFPGMRVFIYHAHEPDSGGVLRISVSTVEYDEDTSLQTLDDVPFDVPIEFYREDDLIIRHDPNEKRNNKEDRVMEKTLPKGVTRHTEYGKGEPYVYFKYKHGRGPRFRHWKLLPPIGNPSGDLSIMRGNFMYHKAADIESAVAWINDNAGQLYTFG